MTGYLFNKTEKKRYLAWNLQGMLVDFGIRPEEASSCGSRTSNSWMSPSTNISLRQSNLTSPSVSLEQFHIRFLGPAFAESVLTTAKRGTALCDNNFPTARRAMTILKCFLVVYLSPVLFSKLVSRILIGRCWPYLCAAVDISRLKWHGCDALVTSRTKLVVWSRCFKKRNVKMHDFKHLCLELFISPNQAHLYLKLPNHLFLQHKKFTFIVGFGVWPKVTQFWNVRNHAQIRNAGEELHVLHRFRTGEVHSQIQISCWFKKNSHKNDAIVSSNDQFWDRYETL